MSKHVVCQILIKAIEKTEAIQGKHSEKMQVCVCACVGTPYFREVGSGRPLSHVAFGWRPEKRHEVLYPVVESIRGREPLVFRRQQGVAGTKRGGGEGGGGPGGVSDLGQVADHPWPLGVSGRVLQRNRVNRI